MREPTRVWYLQMNDAGALRPAAAAPHTDVVRAELPVGALNRFFYTEVGRHHHWVDLLGWSDADWQAHAERVETWLAWERGTPAGYAELAEPEPGVVDVAYFGLLAPFQGRGIGGHLLSETVRRAWERGARRVTLDTCELDGVAAMPNYLARGFRVVREGVELRGQSASS